jgi:PIN domain nuclease of toxin-antitoxin system
MTVFVPDTHALIWRLIEPAKLAAAATRAFNQADAGQAEMQVPAVVLAEMIMVAEKGRVAAWGSAEVGAFVQAAQDS